MSSLDKVSLNEPFFVFGANTNVGKTFFCSLLARVAEQIGARVAYFKPVQTGYPQDDDAGQVKKMAPRVQSLCGQTFHEPLSPHRCAQTKGSAFSDSELLQSVQDFVSGLQDDFKGNGICLVEGAGGVLSPLPSGSLTADGYRPLRYPVVLLADPNLGGISGTITAIEALECRGYDLALIVSFASEHENTVFLRKLCQDRNRTTPVVEVPVQLNPHRTFDALATNELPHAILDSVGQCVSVLQAHGVQRISHLRRLQELSEDVLWWPFTQHGATGSPRVIDAAYGNTLALVGSSSGCQDGLSLKMADGPTLHNVFDASASWWTSGVGHGHPGVSHEVSRALGRYGHVLFPEHTHEPAALLAVELLDTVGAGWASRVFYTDNGSTAVEAALKMAFRRAEREGVISAESLPLVLGLRDSYHGDTIGAMSAASPNGFNHREHWYRPCGVWLDFPRFAYRRGRLEVSGSEVFRCMEQAICPHGLGEEQAGGGWPGRTFQTVSDLFDVELRIGTDLELVEAYQLCVRSALRRFRGRCGAVLIEPCVHGSAGMVGVDPLFQHVLVKAAQAEGIPVVFDEVFSGFWRLGFRSACDVLRVFPDIACYSKTLTGGLLPLAVTLATDAVFQGFHSESKADCLLHGHSYTAHPAGCRAALESLRLYGKRFGAGAEGPLLFWPEETAVQISEFSSVTGSLALGTLFAVELLSRDGSYFSLGAKKLASDLLRRGVAVRPLGPVVYLMSNPLSPTSDVSCEHALAEFVSALAACSL